jgi:hypothetical protein
LSAARGTLARVRTLCLALPEAEERPFGDHTAPAFRVRDKFFVMASEDGSSLTLKAPKGVQAVLVTSDPGRFFVPKYVGHIGWVGVRLNLGEPPDWVELAEMIAESYCLVAPRRLAAQVDLPPTGDVSPVSGRARGR